MSLITPNETAQSWKASKSRDTVVLLLSASEADSAAGIVGSTVAGFPVSLAIVESADWVDPESLTQAAAGIVQVDTGSQVSIERFGQLAKDSATPLIAAAYDPPLALVRSLVRAGAHDVIPLPIDAEELQASLAPIAEARRAQAAHGTLATGKLVSVIKAVGGVGATALLTQLATRFARSEAGRDREACVIDLDMQFGDVAFQLGLRPKLSMYDLLEAGNRLDGAMLRATAVDHAGGLKVIGAPADMMPLEGVPSEHVLQVVELATREYDTVFLDLPTNWTNWSLSLVARSDLVLLVTELTVASLNRARRQLNLLQSQDLGGLDIRIVLNRFDKSLARTISLADARKALGRNIDYLVSNDFPLMRAAVDRGVAIDEIKRKTPLAKDLDALDSGIAAALRLER